MYQGDASNCPEVGMNHAEKTLRSSEEKGIEPHMSQMLRSLSLSLSLASPENVWIPQIHILISRINTKTPIFN